MLRDRSSRLLSLLAAFWLCACTPALNWRKLEPPGAGLQLTFPCKPEQETRQQPGPGGRSVAVQTFTCEAAGAQFSLTWLDLGDAGAVPAAVDRMLRGAAQRQALQASAPVVLRGQSAPGAAQQRLAGAGGEGPVIRQAVFAKGSRVYQLLMHGERPSAQTWDIFIGSVQLAP